MLTRHVFLELAIDRREVDVQARTDGLVIFAEAQHHGLLLFIHHVDRAVQPDHRQQAEAYEQQTEATATTAASGIVITTLLAATEKPVQAFLQLAERFVEIRRALASTAFAAAPRVLIVRVSTRLIPSHSVLRTDKAKARPRRAGQCYPKPHGDSKATAAGFIAKYVAR
jgi:hypothetical protein